LYNCLDALRSSLKEVREENDRLKGERDESSRAWRDSFNSMHQRAMNAEASCEAMAKALEPFSKFAGIVFERIFNNQDPVDTMTAVDGRQVTLHASDFFRVRAALDAYRKEKGE
jgi:predicted phosphohydrolase